MSAPHHKDLDVLTMFWAILTSELHNWQLCTNHQKFTTFKNTFHITVAYLYNQSPNIKIISARTADGFLQLSPQGTWDVWVLTKLGAQWGWSGLHSPECSSETDDIIVWVSHTQTDTCSQNQMLAVSNKRKGVRAKIVLLVQWYEVKVIDCTSITCLFWQIQ